MTTKKQIKDMEFKELIEWAQKADWDNVTNEHWKDYEEGCKRLARKFFLELDFCQLQEFYRTYSSDGIDPWFEEWDRSVNNSYPFRGLLDRIESLETTVKVLLKEQEGKQANITVGQLNRIKGGI